MEDELLSLAARALRDPDPRALLDLARAVERQGAPAALRRPELLRVVLAALWRRPEERLLASLAVRLMGLEPVHGPPARPDPGEFSWADPEGAAYDPASGLPARVRHPGSGALLGLVPPGGVEVSRDGRFPRIVSLPAFWLAVRPASVAEVAAWLGRQARQEVPDDWEIQLLAPEDLACGLSASLALRLAAAAGLRLPSELEFERALAADASLEYRWYSPAGARQSGGAFGHRELLGVLWQWARVTQADTSRHGPVRTEGDLHLTGRGGRWLRGQRRLSLRAREIDRGGTPRGLFGMRLARGLLPPELDGAVELPTAVHPQVAAVWTAVARPSPPPVSAPPGGPGDADPMLGTPARRAGGPVLGMLFLPGERLLVGLEDGLRAFHLESGAELGAGALEGARWPAAVDPGGTQLACAGLAGPELRDAASLEVLRRLEGWEGPLLDLAFVDAGTGLAMVAASGWVLRVSLETGASQVFSAPLARGDQARLVDEARRVLLFGSRRVRARDLCEGGAATHQVLSVPASVRVELPLGRQDWILARGSHLVGELFLERRDVGGDQPLEEEGRCASGMEHLLAVSPDSRRALCAGAGRARLEATGAHRAGLDLPGAAGAVTGCFSPDGARVAVANPWGVLRIFETRAGDEVAPTGGFEAPVQDLAPSPDGEVVHLLVLASDLPLQRWRFGDRAPESMGELPGGEGTRTTCLALSPQGGDLVLGCVSGEARVVLAATPEVLVARHATGCGTVSAAAWDERRQRLVAAGYGGVELWVREALEQRAALPFRSSPEVRLAVATNGRSVAAGSGKQLAVMRPDRRALCWEVTELDSRIQEVAVSADATVVAALLTGGEVVVVGRQGGPWTLGPAAEPTASLALSPDGRLVARGGVRGGLEVYDSRRSRVVVAARRHRGPVRRLVFAAAGDGVVSAGDDTTVRWLSLA